MFQFVANVTPLVNVSSLNFGKLPPKVRDAKRCVLTSEEQ